MSDIYTEMQDAVMVTLTIRAWKHARWSWLPRVLRPKQHATAVFHRDGRQVAVPSWQPVMVPFWIYRLLDSYAAAKGDLDYLEIHDVGIAQDIPLEVPLEKAAG